MTNAITLTRLLQPLTARVQSQRAWQISDPAHPDRGAIYQAAWGVADPRTTGQFIVRCGFLALGDALPDDDLLGQANRAADYLLRARRPSGLIDLISVNIDSGPDTAFAVQELCTVLELARDRSVDHAAWQPLLDKIGTFVREAVPGMLRGGFHTPNHRWVIVSALLQAHALFPDLDVQSVVDSYLAESIDIDDEGMFIERSVGVYDAVNDRALLFIHEHQGLAEALAAVNRNLDTDLHLLHADGSAETGVSRRQDYGTRYVALGLVPYLLWSHHLQPNPQFAAAAAALWQRWLGNDQLSMNDRAAHIDWLIYVLLKFGEPEAVTPALPDSFVRHFPLNGLHRVRRGPRSATFFRDATRILSLTHGEAELSSVKLSQTYFGQYIGRFQADEMNFDGEQLTMRSLGRANPRRPAYELPLGRPVPPEAWQATMAERELRWLPHAETTLTVDEVADGFDLHFRSVGGSEGVAAQLAFDFPPGGVWETDDTRTLTSAGQVIFLKQGWGAMRFGADVIRLGPGHLAHAMWQMRDAEAAPDHVRVLLTFFTPLDFVVQLRMGSGWGSWGDGT